EGLSERAQGVLGDVDWRLATRGVEFGFSLLTWTIIAYGTSVCTPRPNASSGEKDKAKFFFGQHVDSACVFAFFSTITAASSLRAVVQARKGDGADGGAHSSAYKTPSAPTPTFHGGDFAGNFSGGGGGANFHGGAKMEGMGTVMATWATA
ncbi:hypothetical protein M885DRAFT_579341, partial [Pelagophyceae sp. CCMP2097]